MTSEELNQFYESEYRRLYQGDEGPSKKDLDMQRARAAALLSFMDGQVQSVGRHLDIGSSTGELLQAFQKTYGSQPVGVEPGESYRRHAQTQGLKIFPSLEDLKRSNVQRFNLITIAHVLEHLPDPVAYLSNLREEILAPVGWLLLKVPNLYAHDSFEVAHLFGFSSHTLREIVQQAGFEVLVLKKHGAPRSQILPLYLTLLARPASVDTPIQLRLERLVFLKRRLGMFRRRLLSRLFPKQAWISIS
ncbi:MAG: class I SAM-dependent methyltransferase [Chloroflexi bacterium]|nr:class I SAM-dependent methyltransferase [Chloroflexota bacterium]